MGASPKAGFDCYETKKLEPVIRHTFAIPGQIVKSV